MKKYTLHAWFTLVELIVSIMIFGIMMISVMSIFLFSSQMSARVELNRVMQENIKNVIEDISENVRKSWIDGVRNFGDSSYKMLDIDDKLEPADIYPATVNYPTGSTYLTGSTLFTAGSEYVLWTGTGAFLPVSNLADCSDLQSLCRILKKDVSGGFYPLTNSFVSFENISFIITNSDVPRVIINMTARPAYNKGLLPTIVKNNTMHIQTTISERLIETN